MTVNSGKKVTLKTIAEALGVARSTVSNAYNRPDQLSPALRNRILEKARVLGYAGPNPLAASLSRGAAGAIGVVFPGSLSYALTDPVAGLFLRGIALEAEAQGYGLLLIGGEAEADSRREQSRTLAAKAHVDGFVLFNFPGKTPTLTEALKRRLPSVLVDQTGLESLPSVTVDDEVGAYEAAKHLLELGHKRFGVIALELTLDAGGGIIDLQRQRQAVYRPTKDRLQGYAKALGEAGLVWGDAVSVYETVDNTLDEGERAAAALLSQTPLPTALLAMSDQLALGALRYVKARDLAVPENLSIVGYDDAPGAAQVTPALTTVRQPHVAKGQTAAEVLTAQLRGEEVNSVTLKTALVVRASSAYAPL